MSLTSHNAKVANEKSDAQLDEAIKSATVHRLQAVLRDICNASPDAKKLARSMLLIEENVMNAKSENSDVHLNTNKKRPFPSQRYEVCEQCEKEFDVLDNPDDACKWHDGELEADSDGDFWADHDENVHGTIDSDFCREEYPEGFVWDCCDKLGNEEGCQVGPHDSDVGKRIKM
ncbi:hypothetical protein BKA66DRAFT_469725 [Pyrenochaeta sp. MPI-SDFR-AT-0127]|nr:hypothetical protein BKA66DRAFT_469725 [Pyrenochaeta sp. MPI-SDFR-AT-0127]